MKTPVPSEIEDVRLPSFPDIRQTLCHTLLAAAFALLWVFNPVRGIGSGDRGIGSENRGIGSEDSLHLWVMVFIIGFAVSSWVVVLKSWSAWRRIPSSIRELQVQAAGLDKNRAQSHALMSSLSLLLSGFAFLVVAMIPEFVEGPIYRVLFGFAVVVATLSAAVLARAVRDFFVQRKQ